MSLLTGSMKQQGTILKILLKNVSQTNQHRTLRTRCSSFGLQCDSKSDSIKERSYSSRTGTNISDEKDSQSKLFDFHHEWPMDIKNEILRDMILLEDFVCEAEEERLCAEVQKAMRRMRYQYDHWDDAIHGYKEMEKKDWLPENEDVFRRLRSKAFVANSLPHVHILDLAADGIIKPHVDSVRYCGSTIAGISLLTDCIMRLKRVDETKYEQNRIGEDDPNPAQSKEPEQLQRDANSSNESNEFHYFVDVLLKRRSLYIMKDSARYKFSHEVLASKSTFKAQEIIKSRRISIICRNHP